MTLLTTRGLIHLAIMKRLSLGNGSRSLCSSLTSNLNKALNSINSSQCLYKAPLISSRGNFRAYKNFGHRDPDPPTGALKYFIRFYYSVLFLIPTCAYINWKYLLWYFRRDLYDEYNPHEDLSHLYPARPPCV